jgi:hypothetical protein
MLEVSVDGSVVATNTADGSALSDMDWTRDSVSFVGTGSDVEVTFADAGTPDTLGTFLDNVSLVCEEKIVEEECLVDGYVYDKNDNPLEGWTVGMNDLFSTSTEIGTAVSNSDGYYCITGDIEVEENQELLSFIKTLFVQVAHAAVDSHIVYEVLKDGWSGLDITVDGNSSGILGDDYFDVYTEVAYEGSPIQVDFYNEQNPGISTNCVSDCGGGGGGNFVQLTSTTPLDDDPDGDVLGDQVSVVPQGAPNTGAGGTAAQHTLPLFLLSIAAFIVLARKTNNAQ